MKKLILFFLILSLPLFSTAQKPAKLSKDEMANMTPEQRIAYENDRKAKSGKKKKKEDTTKDKVKRAKKQDKAARKVKQPKQPKRKKSKK